MLNTFIVPIYCEINLLHIQKPVMNFALSFLLIPPRLIYSYDHYFYFHLTHPSFSPSSWLVFSAETLLWDYNIIYSNILIVYKFVMLNIVPVLSFEKVSLIASKIIKYKTYIHIIYLQLPFYFFKNYNWIKILIFPDLFIYFLKEKEGQTNFLSV